MNMPEWRIEIPEQTLYWESEEEPDIRLVIDGIDDHRYLLDYHGFNDDEDEE